MLSYAYKNIFYICIKITCSNYKKITSPIMKILGRILRYKLDDCGEVWVTSSLWFVTQSVENWTLYSEIVSSDPTQSRFFFPTQMVSVDVVCRRRQIMDYYIYKWGWEGTLGFNSQEGMWESLADFFKGARNSGGKHQISHSEIVVSYPTS